MYCEDYVKDELNIIEIKSRYERIPICDNCGDLAHSYTIRRKYPFTDAMIEKS